MKPLFSRGAMGGGGIFGRELRNSLARNDGRFGLGGAGIVPLPPLPAGQSWFTMTVTLRVHDDAGNVSDVTTHTGTRLLPQGSCGF